MEYVLAVEALGMNLNFLIIILVVLAVILTAVVILAMYRYRGGHCVHCAQMLQYNHSWAINYWLR